MKFIGGPDDGRERKVDLKATHIDVMSRPFPLRYERYYVIEGEARHSSLVTEEHKLRVSAETPIDELL